MQQNLTERKQCKYNSAIDMCLYGHVPVWTQLDGHKIWLRTYYLSTCIIYIDKATADLESKYRKVYVVYLHTTN